MRGYMLDFKFLLLYPLRKGLDLDISHIFLKYYLNNNNNNNIYIFLGVCISSYIKQWSH